MKKWRLIFFSVLILGIVLAVVFFPEDIPTSNISYEQVDVTVRKIDTRRVKTSRYTHETRYDVSLMYEGKTYVWTASTDPHLVIGMHYNFYFSGERMYRTEQEMQRNITITSAPWQVRAGAILAFISMVGFFVTFAPLKTKTKNKKLNA